MSPAQVQSQEESRAAFAGRIDVLYILGRHYLSLPFAVLCIPVTLFGTHSPGFLVLMPLCLQIAVVIAAEQLTSAYKRRGLKSNPQYWADRYTFVSAIAGATWGVGAWFWFVPGSYPAQAYLALAFLGMTATEFIARSAHRPAYIAHASLALTPLVFLLLREGGLYASMTAVLIVLFTAVLTTYCRGVAGLMEECVQLRDENKSLIENLSHEKQEAEHARDAALASAQAKSVFIANISHELRTPLNALLGMTQLLDRAELEKPHRDHVKVMLEAGRGLQTLLDDVIALTRADDDGAGEDCDPAQAARAVARLLQPRAWEKHLKLSVTTAANLPRVAADPKRVRQMLLKLADNGLKFTDRGGVEIKVESELREMRTFVRFSVIDSGHGVPKEIAQNLYRPFVPGDTSYSRQQQGAGLGLSVVKRVVERLNGLTGFESEPGEGSTFWFSIPATAQANDASTIEQSAPPLPKDFSILAFVPDETGNRKLASLLQTVGKTVKVAQTLADAVVSAGRGNFDVIIASAADADTLAAAPGVRTPILALMRGGDRLPACANGLVPWPAPASELFAALKAVTESRQQDLAPEPPPTGSVTAIDTAAFAALEKSVGVATLVEILRSYIESAEQLCRALGDASDDANWQEATRLAQDIAGSAGSLGLTAMTAAARGFAQSAREGASSHELRNTAQLIVWEHERVRRSLTNLYPDLIASSG
ncbi:MAG TPA: ATP-binding protein [Rhizomicrobium sp.]|nr:ATP-binding protein [Rhizomicrobium sp.]